MSKLNISELRSKDFAEMTDEEANNYIESIMHEVYFDGLKTGTFSLAVLIDEKLGNISENDSKNVILSKIRDVRLTLLAGMRKYKEEEKENDNGESTGE